VQQQQGVLFRQTQQAQPAFMHAHTQSQQAWIISQHALSPLVQVKQTPSLIVVHSHLHMHMLHWHIIMPLFVQHRPSIPPAIILHMFCMVAAARSSSQWQVILTPPAHFSTFIAQRGTMHMPGIIADMPGIWPIIGIGLDMPIAAFTMLRSIIIALDITHSLFAGRGSAASRRVFADSTDVSHAPRLVCAPLARPVGNAGHLENASRDRVGRTAM